MLEEIPMHLMRRSAASFFAYDKSIARSNGAAAGNKTGRAANILGIADKMKSARLA